MAQVPLYRRGPVVTMGVGLALTCTGGIPCAQTDSEAGAMDAVIERIHKMISSLSYSEMDELIELIQRERAGKMDEARRSLKAEFEAKAALIGLTPGQIFSQSQGVQEKPKRGKNGEQQSTPSAVKFRSPSGQTWSGRGRKPLWLNQAEAAGQTAEEFRVHG